jgi:hypothetical protein
MIKFPFNIKSIMRISSGLILVLLSILIDGDFASGQSSRFIERQTKYLSGTDNINTVTWDFYCTGGRRSGFRTTIEVPSCWEQQGFGLYNYGRDYYAYGGAFKYAAEKGIYRYEFAVPKDWNGKKVDIVFEGSMTDTEVKINGKPAGEIHQGAFYRFRYDISDLLNYGTGNLLEVTVSKMSSNQSVNEAERYADYWIFGGIFRPVYLEAFPKEHIQRVAIAASSDGLFIMQVFPVNLKTRREIHAEIIDAHGNIVAKSTIPVNMTDSLAIVEIKLDNPLLWTAETPNLYHARIYLCDSEKRIIYQTSEKFGFRTIRVRHGDGIYINNKKVKMKGINRHVFWPETGRTVNREIDLTDVKLIKGMNMNAVRCSHYPPDQSFLEICDSLGLYVLDELAGWHDAYDTRVGEKLVREMVVRDVNHPSVIFWSNGNEGGHNFDLDNDFSLYDPSNRVVIHAHHRPNHAFNGIDCNHYEPYESVKKILQDTLIYMTTEFLHSQNDGGGGAGLYDYWELMRKSPISGGGFIWAFLDEGIVRTDLRNIIDVNGVNAPDGVVGPHREKEGSYDAIRAVFAPVYIHLRELSEAFNGELPVENRFDFTNLNQCSFHWQLVIFNSPADQMPGYELLHEGNLPGPDIKPGEKGVFRFDLPPGWKNADALLVRTYDPFGNKIQEWSWMIKNNEEILKRFMDLNGDDKINVRENDSAIAFSVKGVTFILSKQNGSLTNVLKMGRRRMNFSNGPLLCAGKQVFDSLIHYPAEDGYVIEVKYKGDMKYAHWKLYNSGWLELKYTYELSGSFDFTGISFDFPEDIVLGAKWLGNGPYRVWKNRMEGGSINVWENACNLTRTGSSPWTYPEFNGYFSDIRWLEINTVEGKILMATKESNLFVRLFDFYGLPGIIPQPELPPGDISLLDNIPPVGTKMNTRINAQPWLLGPQSQKNQVNGELTRTVYFFFGLLQK